MKRLKVKVVVFDGETVEKQSYTVSVDGVQLMDEMAELEPMRWMAMAAADAVRDAHVKLLPIYGKKGTSGEYRG